MLVCSCNFITDREIRDVIIDMLDEDCWQLIVPAKVYHAMQKRGRCCGCFPNVVDIIVETTRDYHRSSQTADERVISFMDRLEQFHDEQKSQIASRHSASTKAA